MGEGSGGSAWAGSGESWRESVAVAAVAEQVGNPVE